MTNAEKIEIIRRAHGWNQTQMGDAVGVKQNMISLICKGGSCSARVQRGIDDLYFAQTQPDSAIDKPAKPTYPAAHQQALHDQVIEARTEARIYRELIDKYFSKHDNLLAKLYDITSKFENTTHETILPSQDTPASQSQQPALIRPIRPIARPHRHT